MGHGTGTGRRACVQHVLIWCHGCVRDLVWRGVLLTSLCCGHEGECGNVVWASLQLRLPLHDAWATVEQWRHFPADRANGKSRQCVSTVSGHPQGWRWKRGQCCITCICLHRRGQARNGQGHPWLVRSPATLHGHCRWHWPSLNVLKRFPPCLEPIRSSPHAPVWGCAHLLW